MPRERPGDKFGTSQGHPGRLGRFMWKFTFKVQNVRGTAGTDDGTDGICPREGGDTNQGVSRQNSLCLLVIFFPGVLRGNTIRGNTTRNSERKMALWEGLWEGLWKTSESLCKPLKTSKYLWTPLPLRGPLRDPLRGSEPLKPVAPNRVAP